VIEKIGELEIERMGSGAPLVLLHALPFDRRFWSGVAPSLAREHELIIPSLRGFGASALGAGTVSVERWSDDLWEVLLRCRIARCALVGVSMGGYVALAFAERHPQATAALVLSATKAGPDGEPHRAAREQMMALVERAGVSEYLRVQAPRLLGPAATDGARSRLLELASPSPAGVIAALAAIRDRRDRTASLAAIRCPTLLLFGSDDAITGPADRAVLEEGLRPVQPLVRVIPGAGHLPNLEDPQGFAQAVLDFLRPAP
jgi:pimeloyl-ACP methyl ester carboxylesterase